MRPSAEYFKKLVGANSVNICELGVADGKNALELYLNFSCKRLWLIDSWSQNYKSVVNDWLIETSKKFDNKKNVVIIKANSIHISDLIPDNSLDYLYIDDLHSAPHVQKEIDLYLPKIKIGGIIAGHDFDCNLSGRVYDGVMEYARVNKIDLKFKDLDFWFIK